MDLKSILEKTKNKSERAIHIRKPPSIATSDRPYLIEEVNKKQNYKKTNENKLDTNRWQTEDKPRTNRGQTGDKLETNWRQTGDKLETPVIETRDRTEDKTRDKLGTNWRQTEDKLMAVNCNVPFSSFVGLQRSLIITIFNECKLSRSKITNSLSTEYLAKACKSTALSVKKSIQRLEKKGALSRASFKNGRSGWTKYELAEKIYNDVILEDLNVKLGTNWGQTEDKVETKVETKLRTNPPNSSSNYKTTITLGGDKNSVVASEWNLNITPLAHIGFTEKHLEQISKRTKHPPEDVQEAIHAFAHDLANNKLRIRNGNEPLSFFMGIMGKGDLYLPVSSDYANPTLKAAQLYLEKRKAYESECQKIDDALRNEDFENWVTGLSQEEKDRILPEEVKQSPFKPHIRSSLSSYHGKRMWPERRVGFYQEKGIPFFELSLE